MVKFASLAVAIMAAVSGTSAVVPPPFKQACTFPYDVCGWTLTDGVHGKPVNFLSFTIIPTTADNTDIPPPAYDPAVLRAAAEAAGQHVDPNGNQSIIYDAIYNCQANGAIAWNRYCGSGKCEAGQQVPNANCRP